MKKLSLILALIAITGIYFAGCSDDDTNSTKPEPDTILKVVVLSQMDSSVIANSNVVVYQAETSQPVIRDLTDMFGACYFKLDEGNYYLEVSAQEYYPSPVPNVTPVPFFVSYQDTTAQVRYLDFNTAESLGYIEGKVEPPAANFLLIAEISGDLISYSGVTGPDGYFVLYNLPYETYNLKAYKAGYQQIGSVTSVLSIGTAQSDSVTVQVQEYAGSSMSGSLSFIAGAEAKLTDLVLRDPKTMSIIPGMSVTTDSTNSYSFEKIPDGEFILWASLKNDRNVMDPDKNLGGIDVSFPDDNGLDKSIDITGAITITSPTNPADSIYAYMAGSQNPTFTWIKESSYSSVKEYIIEVRTLNGVKIWGGFDESGVVLHPQISGGETSFQYPLTAPDLIPGEVYQWKIYADNDAALNVQGLLSSSEDLMGIFQVPVPVLKK